MTLSDLKHQVLNYVIPEDKESFEEFDEKSSRKLEPRASTIHSNPFFHLHRSVTDPTALSTIPTDGDVESKDHPIFGNDDDFDGNLYVCELDPSDGLVVKEKDLSLTSKKTLRKRLVRSKSARDPCPDAEVFVYKGEILECHKKISDYGITDQATIFYGKPKKISFGNSGKAQQSFFTTSDTLASELREMITKMGLLAPNQEIAINAKALEDRDLLDETSTETSSTQSQDEIQLNLKRNVVRVLALDGGGIRGVAVATILIEIEKVTKKRIHELFDVVVGTSTGGLLALMLTVPNLEGKVLTAEEALNVYLNYRHEIFKKNPWFKQNPANPKYTGESFEQVVKNMYGDRTIKGAVKPVGVVVTDYDLHKSILVNSMRAALHEDDFRHNIPVWKAARATAAAPTYFPPVFLGCNIAEKKERSVSPTNIKEAASYTRNSITYEDGGTTSNNPGLLGLKYAERALAATAQSIHHDLQLISVGTGTTSGKDSAPPVLEATGSLLNFVSKFRHDPLFMARNSYNTHNQVMDQYFEGKEGPGSDYFRIQFKITKDQWNHMDRVDNENLKSLMSAARTYLYQQNGHFTSHFKGVIDLLNEEVERPNLTIDIKCAQCHVRTQFYSFLSDYFAHKRFKTKVSHTSLIKDLYINLTGIDKEYTSSRVKSKSHKTWLLDSLKTKVPQRIADSMVWSIQMFAVRPLSLLDDKGERQLKELREAIMKIDFDPIFSQLNITGTFSGVFQSREKIFRRLSKTTRGTILDTQVYRDICRFAKNQFEAIANRVHELLDKLDGEERQKVIDYISQAPKYVTQKSGLGEISMKEGKMIEARE